MSQLVCPRCSGKGFLLSIRRAAGVDDVSSGDPTGTLECPGCHTTIEFRACGLPIIPHPIIHYPLQRFEYREYVGVARSLYGGKGHMLPSDNGEWVRHADHVQRVEGQAEVLRRRNETIDQLYAKHDTLHAQWERQKGTISYLSEEVDELKKKLQVAESQKNQAQMELAREQRDRWMKEVYQASGMPVQDPFGASFNRGFQQAMQPGGIFLKPYPTHAEVTIKHLNERILAQEKAMAAFRWMHTAAVKNLTAELAACRSTLKAAEQERDAEKLKLQKFREVLIGLTF